MLEEWRDVPGYEGIYSISSLGRVKSLERKVWNGLCFRLQKKLIMKPGKSGGYLSVNLRKELVVKTRKIHSLVALAFIGFRPPDANVCHNDGNLLNNSIENLRYDTQSSNILDSVLHKTHHESRKTHCNSGHLLDGDAVKKQTSPSGRAWRTCRICRKLRESIRTKILRDAKLNPQEREALRDAGIDLKAALDGKGR